MTPNGERAYIDPYTFIMTKMSNGCDKINNCWYQNNREDENFLTQDYINTKITYKKNVFPVSQTCKFVNLLRNLEH